MINEVPRKSPLGGLQWLIEVLSGTPSDDPFGKLQVGFSVGYEIGFSFLQPIWSYAPFKTQVIGDN